MIEDLGLRLARVTARSSDNPFEAYEIDIFEFDIEIWNKYIIRTFREPDFVEYIQNNCAWKWPASEFRNYVTEELEKDFILVNEISLIEDGPQGAYEIPFVGNIMNEGCPPEKKKEVISSIFDTNYYEENLYRKTKLNEKLKAKFQKT